MSRKEITPDGSLLHLHKGVARGNGDWGFLNDLLMTTLNRAVAGIVCVKKKEEKKRRKKKRETNPRSK